MHNLPPACEGCPMLAECQTDLAALYAEQSAETATAFSAQDHAVVNEAFASAVAEQAMEELDTLPPEFRALNAAAVASADTITEMTRRDADIKRHKLTATDLAIKLTTMERDEIAEACAQHGGGICAIEGDPRDYKPSTIRNLGRTLFSRNPPE